MVLVLLCVFPAASAVRCSGIKASSHVRCASLSLGYERKEAAVSLAAMGKLIAPITRTYLFGE